MAQSSPSSRSLLLVAAVVALAAVGGGFLVADFEAATFETSANATTTAGAANSSSLQPVSSAYLVVDAPDAVRDDLTDELVAAFERDGIALDAVEARESYDRPVVVVVVDEWDVRWNPVVPVGGAEWRAVYDAGGHGTHVDAALGDGPLVFTSTDGPDLVVTSDIDLDLRARGVVSRPAFRTHLVRAVADATATRVTGQTDFHTA